MREPKITSSNYFSKITASIIQCSADLKCNLTYQIFTTLPSGCSNILLSMSSTIADVTFRTVNATNGYFTNLRVYETAILPTKTIIGVDSSDEYDWGGKTKCHLPVEYYHHDVASGVDVFAFPEDSTTPRYYSIHTAGASASNTRLTLTGGSTGSMELFLRGSAVVSISRLSQFYKTNAFGISQNVTNANYYIYATPTSFNFAYMLNVHQTSTAGEYKFISKASENHFSGIIKSGGDIIAYADELDTTIVDSLSVTSIAGTE